MNKNENRAQEMTISLEQIFRIILTYILPILLVTVIAAGAAFAVTKIFTKTKYTTEILMRVDPNPEQTALFSTSEKNAASALIKQYKVIIEKSGVLDDVAQVVASNNPQYTISSSKIKSGLSVYDDGESGLMGISYTDTNKDRAKAVIEALKTEVPKKLKEIAKVGDISPFDSVVTTATPPKTVRNTVIAAVVGFVASSLVFVLISLLDTRIRTVEDLSETFDITILGSIPTIASNMENAEIKKEEDDE